MLHVQFVSTNAFILRPALQSVLPYNQTFNPQHHTTYICLACTYI